MVQELIIQFMETVELVRTRSAFYPRGWSVSETTPYRRLTYDVIPRKRGPPSARGSLLIGAVNKAGDKSVAAAR